MPAIDSQREGNVLLLQLRGDAGLDAAEELLGKLDDVEMGVEEIVLDLGEAGHLGSATVAALGVAGKRLTGKRLRIRGASEEHLRSLSMAKAEEPAPAGSALRPTQVDKVQALGAAVFEGLGAFRTFWEMVVSIGGAIADVVRRRARFPVALTIEQSVMMGVNALPIVALLSMLLGVILAFQAAFQLRQFGANIYVADLVSISMVREFGPMMTAIILAGRSGSAIAAELGTMKVQEEIDALKTMGIAPARVLLLPRLASLVFMGPTLTLLAMYIGVIGGLVIAIPTLDVSADMYVSRSIEVLKMRDLVWGLGKSAVFALLIALIGCHAGLSTAGGAQSVGRSTTRAVVASIFLIIVTDGVFAIVSTLVKRG